MKNYRNVFLGLLLLFNAGTASPVTAAAASGPLLLARDNKALAPIVLLDDALPAEKNAAAQLQKYLNQITGAQFEIRAESAVAEASPQILVGGGKRARKLLPTVKWDDLSGDEVIARTVSNKIVLAGDRPRGTLYAAFTFLEDELGCRWWSSNESTIPRRSTLSIRPFIRSFVPSIKVRELTYRDSYKSPEFLASLRLNGHYNGIAEEWGGNISFVPDLVHTFYKLLPPEKYYAAHPEWYSEIGGKRIATPRSQLCLTNP